MKKRLLVLTSVSILILLFLISIGRAEDEVEFSFTGGKSLYAKSKEMLYGLGFRLLLNSKSYYFDIQSSSRWKNSRSGIEEFNQGQLKIEYGQSLKCFALNLSYDFYEEKARLFPFGQPKNTIIAEKWGREELSAGLGLKAGRYDKSFINLVAIGGYSRYQNVDDWRFINQVVEKDWSEGVLIGGNIKARLSTCLKNTTSKKVYLIPIWIDFQGYYNHYPKDKDYRAEAELGLGFKIIKNLGVKGNLAAIQTRDRSFTKYYTFSVGLVLILQ